MKLHSVRTELESLLQLHQAPDTPEEPLARYTRLRQLLMETVRTIGQLMRSANSMPGEHEILKQLLTDLEQDCFQIGLFGTTYAGKSTLANALTGTDLLRPGMGETSRVLTYIRWIEGDPPPGKVKLEYKTLEDLEADFQSHCCNLGCTLPDNLRIDLADETFRSWLRCQLGDDAITNRIDTADSVKYLSFFLKGWDECCDKLGTELELDRQEAEVLAHREDIACYIRRRIIFDNNPATGHRRIWIDAPGIGSSFARHTDEAVNLAKSIDAAIMVVRVGAKFLQVDKDFFRDALDVQRSKGRNNLIFVLTRLKEIRISQYPALMEKLGREPSFDECVDYEIDTLRDKLAACGIVDVPILAVDSECGRWARRIQQDPANESWLKEYDDYALVDRKAKVPDPQRNLEASRLQLLEEELGRHLTNIRYHSFLGRKLDRLEQLLGSWNGRIRKTIEGLTSDLASLEHELASRRKERKTLQGLLRDFTTSEMPEMLAKRHGNLDDKVEEVIEDTGRIISKEVNRLKNSFYVFPGAFVRDVLSSSIPAVKLRIQTLRNEYEACYKQVREEALTNQIPDIVSEYGDGLDWTLKQSDLEEAINNRVQGLEGLHLGFFRELWIGVQHLFASILGMNLGDLVRDKLINKYHEKFADQFRRDIAGWVTDDMEAFGEQVQREFKRLADGVERTIEDQIAIKRKTESDRQDAIRQLEHYEKETDHVLNTILKELAQKVEAARPMRAQPELVVV